jgi:hypothetical protein
VTGSGDDGALVVLGKRGGCRAVEAVECVHLGVPDADDVVLGGDVAVVDVQDGAGPDLELAIIRRIRRIRRIVVPPDLLDADQVGEGTDVDLAGVGCARPWSQTVGCSGVCRRLACA